MIVSLVTYDGQRQVFTEDITNGHIALKWAKTAFAERLNDLALHGLRCDIVLLSIGFSPSANGAFILLASKVHSICDE